MLKFVTDTIKDYSAYFTAVSTILTIAIFLWSLFRYRGNLARAWDYVSGFWPNPVARRPARGGLTYTERAMVGMGALGLVALVLYLPAGLILLGLNGLLGIFSAREIKADPPEMGLVEFWGSPREVLIKPRYAFVLKPLENFITLPGGQIVLEFVFEGVSCGISTPGGAVAASGGFVTVKVTVIGRVSKDRKKAYQFVIAGRDAGVKEITEDQLEQATREHGSTLDWETFRAGKKELAKKLHDIVTMETPAFDLGSIGFEVIQTLVKSVEPEGPLKAEAQKYAGEFQQRRAEKMDIETGIQLAEQMVEKAVAKGEKLTLKDALELVRIERGRAREVIVRGLEQNPLGGVGALSNATLFGPLKPA